jgi:hypothetical protein
VRSQSRGERPGAIVEAVVDQDGLDGDSVAENATALSGGGGGFSRLVVEDF